tara:strand:+ start:71 stop:421 length:351 start_codon:yes stop_codon:yes gene_type:complete
MAQVGITGNQAYKDQIATNASAATTANFTLTDNISTFTHVAVQFVWSGLDATDGVIKTQWSIDGTNWEDSQSYTIGTASGSHILSDDGFTAHMFRVSYTKGSNSAGTINVYANAKD